MPLSRRVDPRLSWEDLVLPRETQDELEELVARWRSRREVLETWGLGRRLKSSGLVALFAGEPGTGKTEAASVVAQAIGLTLYQVHAPGLLSKYIGETEKNIDAILSIADQRADEVALLFDEAEALFAKRVEAKGSGELAHNSQIGLLLSRLERFSGLAILTTNNPSMIDPAFKRRFQVYVEFELPTPEARERILRLALGQAPVSRDLDLGIVRGCALSGGGIQNVALQAACLAQIRGSVVTSALLREAVAREEHKMGRLVRS
jgi:SpoVK/Ycf46/Vps4 family AAA+-type ATPase